jgi:aminoglycoside 6'-N-acetyltransferase
MTSLPGVTLRGAVPADAPLLRRWDQQPHVIAAKSDADWAWETELGRSPDWRERLIAELDGRPIGFVQIIDPAREETRYWGDAPENFRAIDLWIGDAADLGKGYGTRMMQLALERCFADPKVFSVLLDPLESNTRSHKFYDRIGFRCMGQRRFGKDDCLVYRLDRRSHESNRITAYGVCATAGVVLMVLSTVLPEGWYPVPMLFIGIALLCVAHMLKPCVERLEQLRKARQSVRQL